MLVSHKWLQRFFDEALPSAEEIAEKLTFGAFEIEGIEKRGDDTLIEVKVLPDRACYALSHRGIAREVATLCNLRIKDPLRDPLPTLEPKTEEIVTTIYSSDGRCPFYAAALIRGVKVGPSPAWLKEHLESVGQKSINNIVDATNFVMLDLGTPLHAFDAGKLRGSIGVRAAKDGERIALLGGVEKTLTAAMTVITDAETDAPIAIAGVKGGSAAELIEETKDIIIEAAKFDPTRTRKTAATLNLKTDASKRFENNIAIELPSYGMQAVVRLILEIAGGELQGYATTELWVRPPYKRGVSAAETNRLLGTRLSDTDVEHVFDRLGFAYERIGRPVASAVEVANEQIGKPYKLGASVSREAPQLFDCSGLIAYAYAQAGVFIPRISVDQYVWGEQVAREDLQSGDLIFFNTDREGVKVWYETLEYMKGTKVPEGVSHVALYVGEGTCIHARKTENAVVREPLAAIESRATVVGCRRVAQDIPRTLASIPFERRDLHIPAGTMMGTPQDLIEEIGRVYGYGNIEARELPPAMGVPESNQRWMAAEAVRRALAPLGFTEVYSYTLRADGEVKLRNALAADKGTVRSALTPGLTEALEKNAFNAPLLGLDVVKIFEIGNVFTKKGEQLRVAIAARPLERKKRAEKATALLLEAKAAFEQELGVEIDHQIGEEVLEFDLGSIAAKIPVRHASLPLIAEGVHYQPISVYPFVLRDISMWVPDTDEARGHVLRIFGENGAELLKHVVLFDQFKKDGRNSLAFHMVFQSHERSLTDAEVNAIMKTIEDSIKSQGWEVR